MNPYAVLGIGENSNKEQIKEAYLNLARQHHPDRGGDANKFKEATDAYDILLNNKPNPQHTTSTQHRPCWICQYIYTRPSSFWRHIFSIYSQSYRTTYQS